MEKFIEKMQQNKMDRKAEEQFIKLFKNLCQNKIYPELEIIKDKLNPTFKVDYSNQITNKRYNKEELLEINVISNNKDHICKRVRIEIIANPEIELFRIHHRRFSEASDAEFPFSEASGNIWQGDKVQFSDLNLEDVFDDILPKSFVVKIK